MKPIVAFPPAGFSHCKQGLIGMFYHGKVMSCELVAETNNQYDNYAVRIDCCGQKIGYVPRGYVMAGARSVSGNYNQFLSQCIQAGMKFKAVALLRLQRNNGKLWDRGDNIYEFEPTVVILPYEYELSNFSEEIIDVIDDIDDIINRTTFIRITGVSYHDGYGFFNGGSLYYNAYSDSFCVWGGREMISDAHCGSADIEIVEEDHNARKATKSGFLFIKKANINTQSICNHNAILKLQIKGDIKELFDKFIERNKA